MTSEHDPAHRIYPSASQSAEQASHGTATPQTLSPSYKLAFADPDFLLREDLRPVRFQLELMKPELYMKERGIGSTVVFYGSARIPETGHVLSRYYTEARTLAQRLSQLPQRDDMRHFVVMSGGGPSIMEAANRGAHDVGAPSVALNIVLPHEQAPNQYVTPELSFQFHYFALRKMHFLMRARALCVFPGGFGTFDEMFETLTLIQTGKIDPIPIFLFGKAFWNTVVNFDALVNYGVINKDDLKLFRFVETAEDAFDSLSDFYSLA